MAIFQIHDNQITNGSVIGTQNIYEAPQNINWEEIEREVNEIVHKLSLSDKLHPAVSELQKAAKHRRWDGFKEVAKKFATDFSSAAFANLASGALLGILLPK